MHAGLLPSGQVPGLASDPGRMPKALLILGSTVGNLLSVTPTVAVTLGVFLVPIATEFGWSRTQVSGAFAALSLANAAMFPLAGRLADRLGTRNVLVAGYALLGLSILLLSQLPPAPLPFYLLFALTGAIGALPSNMLLCKLLSEWFDRGRGFWMGLTGGIGNGVGATIMPVFAARLMASYGWRGGFVGIGLLVLLVGLPIAWLTLRPPPSRLAPGHDGEAELTGMTLPEALRSPLFWVIFSAVPVGGGALTAVFANAIPILTARGLSLGQAALVTSLFAMICTVWEPLVGYLLDRSRRPRLVAPFYLAAVCGLLLLAHAHSFGLLLLGGIITGIGLGSEFSVMPYVLSRYFGLKAMGAIAGIAFAGTLTSSALAPILLNAAFDATGSYAIGLYVVAALLAYTTIVFLFLADYPDRYSSTAQ